MTHRIDMAAYRRIVILTGAGVSAASGLDTFRGHGGLWRQFDAEACATATALRTDPLRVWRLISFMRRGAKTAKPNPAHQAIVALENKLRATQSLTVVTQNIDGLHQRAGSHGVIELHGRLSHTRCANPRCSLKPFEDWELYETQTPRCEKCGAVLRPDVVLFEELLPPDAYRACDDAVRACDLFLAVGTSCTVHPACDFVFTAKDHGATAILVNLEPPENAVDVFDEIHLGPAEELLPALLG
ncbi:MAG TPA: NAD-dependent deacylase [Candidatus Hydrogenedentes bacterium]|nr:NAD-dependent deacylase [Candidatus Hydrogenedentota bacterium]